MTTKENAMAQGTILISAVKGVAAYAARINDADIMASTFELSDDMEPAQDTATFALQAICTLFEHLVDKLGRGTYDVLVQDQVALRLVAMPSNIKKGGATLATEQACKNLINPEHGELLQAIALMVEVMSKRGVEIRFANTRTLFSYELIPVNGATLKKDDTVEMDHSTSVDGNFICKDNSYVTGTYTVDVTPIKRPDGSVREKYTIARHNQFGELGELTSKDIFKLLGTEEGTKAIAEAANAKGDSAVKWVSRLALYRAVVKLLPRITLKENFNKVSEQKLF